MKRKRGHKKGKSKGAKAARVSEASKPAPTRDAENDSANDGVVQQDEPGSGTEVNTPSSSGTDQPSNVASSNPDGTIEKTGSKPVSRMKVKLKTSKVSGSQNNSPDALTQSDTDKSSQKMDVDKQIIDVDKKEDSIDSSQLLRPGSSENPSKKAASIKIKTPKAVASSSTQTSNGGEVESVQKMELKEPVRNSEYNKEELDSALSVIKKVMKMDAAEPFNVPVDPIALGIPDYFDVIDTPMDFGTICANLEKGGKYKNSEDVFNDVEYIWGNCYKYNNKGDYILDLMRRVKKNFMKYWTSASLYSGSEGNQGENASGKGGPKAKGKKRHGFRRHKNDCLCAICVLKRKRKEREERERIALGPIAEELKQQDPSNLGSPGGEDSSSNSEDSEDQDADMEEKGEEVKSETSPRQQQGPPDQKEDGKDEKDGRGDEMDTRTNDDIRTQSPAKSQQTIDLEVETATKEQEKGPESSGVQDSSRKEIALENLEENSELQHQKTKEAREKKQRAQLYESLYNENPTLLSLCGSLFPDNPNSVWCGPHSLIPQRQPSRPSSMLSAIESLTKKLPG